MKEIMILGTLIIAGHASAQYKAYGAANNIFCSQPAVHSAKLMAQEAAAKHCQSLGMQYEETESLILKKVGQACWTAEGGYAGAAIELTYNCI